MAKYLLRVTASDGKFQASVLVEIFVLDLNDNSPQCSQVRAWYGWCGSEGKEAGVKGKRKEQVLVPSLGLASIDHTYSFFWWGEFKFFIYLFIFKDFITQ